MKYYIEDLQLILAQAAMKTDEVAIMQYSSGDLKIEVKDAEGFTISSELKAIDY